MNRDMAAVCMNSLLTMGFEVLDPQNKFGKPVQTDTELGGVFLRKV